MIKVKALYPCKSVESVSSVVYSFRTIDKLNGLYGCFRWTVSMGLKMKLTEKPDPPKWVLDMFNASEKLGFLGWKLKSNQ